MDIQLDCLFVTIEGNENEATALQRRCPDDGLRLLGGVRIKRMKCRRLHSAIWSAF
jgi:hypothetical protein